MLRFWNQRIASSGPGIDGAAVAPGEPEPVAAVDEDVQLARDVVVLQRPEIAERSLIANPFVASLA
jgi:hypothetical protein